MVRARPYWIALAAVTLWGAFAVAYIGVEDGSSGLSPVGCAHAAFLLPGIWLLQPLLGPLGNGDLPLVAAVSWCGYAAPALVVAHLAARLQARR